jgi:hypothetical protein
MRRWSLFPSGPDWGMLLVARQGMLGIASAVRLKGLQTCLFARS